MSPYSWYSLRMGKDASIEPQEVGMTENYENFLYQEILAKLKKLEKENERLTEHLRAHNKMIVELRQDLKAEAADTTKHFGRLGEEVVEIHEMYAPVLFRLFPEKAKARRDMKSIIDNLVLPPKK